MGSETNELVICICRLATAQLELLLLLLLLLLIPSPVGEQRHNQRAASSIKAKRSRPRHARHILLDIRRSLELLFPTFLIFIISHLILRHLRHVLFHVLMSLQEHLLGLDAAKKNYCHIYISSLEYNDVFFLWTITHAPSGERKDGRFGSTRSCIQREPTPDLSLSLSLSLSL